MWPCKPGCLSRHQAHWTVEAVLNCPSRSFPSFLSKRERQPYARPGLEDAWHCICSFPLRLVDALILGTTVAAPGSRDHLLFSPISSSTTYAVGTWVILGNGQIESEPSCAGVIEIQEREAELVAELEMGGLGQHSFKSPEVEVLWAGEKRGPQCVCRPVTNRM